MPRKMNVLEMKRMLKLLKSGYAGVDKKGNIVDRQENPKAIALQKNQVISVIEPKKLEGEE